MIDNRPLVQHELEGLRAKLIEAEHNLKFAKARASAATRELVERQRELDDARETRDDTMSDIRSLELRLAELGGLARGESESHP